MQQTAPSRFWSNISLVAASEHSSVPVYGSNNLFVSLSRTLYLNSGQVEWLVDSGNIPHFCGRLDSHQRPLYTAPKHRWASSAKRVELKFR